MDTFLTLVIALGGIATGIGAIWAAIAARRQGQLSERQALLTERSLAEQRQSFQEQTEIARHQARLTERSLAEQNERSRLNLEVDLLLRLEDRFVGPQLLDARRGTARYIVENFIVDGSLLEVDRLNRDGCDVLNFFEDLGYFVKIGAVEPHTMWRAFGWQSFAYWAVGKTAVANERGRLKEPKLYEDWERLMHELFELSRRGGGEFIGELTEEELHEFIEGERFVGEVPPSKE